MKYVFIQENRKNFALHIMTRVLSVTNTGYLTWKRRGPSARKQEDDVLREAILPEGAWLGSRGNQSYSRKQQTYLRCSEDQKLTRRQRQNGQS